MLDFSRLKGTRTWRGPADTGLAPGDATAGKTRIWLADRGGGLQRLLRHGAQPTAGVVARGCRTETRFHRDSTSNRARFHSGLWTRTISPSTSSTVFYCMCLSLYQQTLASFRHYPPRLARLKFRILMLQLLLLLLLTQLLLLLLRLLLHIFLLFLLILCLLLLLLLQPILILLHLILLHRWQPLPLAAPSRSIKSHTKTRYGNNIMWNFFWALQKIISDNS